MRVNRIKIRYANEKKRGTQGSPVGVAARLKAVTAITVPTITVMIIN